MKKLLRTISLFIASLGLMSAVVLAPAAGAIDITEQGGQDTSVITNSGGTSFYETMKRVISTILVVLGIAAVIVIIIGGIRFATSNGDPAAIKAARNTVLYAAVGLVVAILSYAIVNFVLGAFIK